MDTALQYRSGELEIWKHFEYYPFEPLEYVYEKDYRESDIEKILIGETISSKLLIEAIGKGEFYTSSNKYSSKLEESPPLFVDKYCGLSEQPIREYAEMLRGEYIIKN